MYCHERFGKDEGIRGDACNRYERAAAASDGNGGNADVYGLWRDIWMSGRTPPQLVYVSSSGDK